MAAVVEGEAGHGRGCVARGCCFGECAELSSAKQMSRSRGVLHRRKLRGRVRSVAALKEAERISSGSSRVHVGWAHAGGWTLCSVRVRGRSLAHSMQTFDCSTTESGADPAAASVASALSRGLRPRRRKI